MAPDRKCQGGFDRADLDADGDLDLHDFLLFQQALTGPQ